MRLKPYRLLNSISVSLTKSLSSFWETSGGYFLAPMKVPYIVVIALLKASDSRLEDLISRPLPAF